MVPEASYYYNYDVISEKRFKIYNNKFLFLLCVRCSNATHSIRELKTFGSRTYSFITRIIRKNA